MTNLLSRYDALLAAGELRPDPEQHAAAARLSLLQQELETPPTAGLLSKLFGKASPTPRGL